MAGGDPVSAIDNPYWDAVRDHISTTGSLWGTPEVSYELAIRRTDLVRQYSWTITDPATVAFVASHSRGRVVDPMAGTGYWAWLLAQHGVHVAAYDLTPPQPDSEANRYHRNATVHATVTQADALDAVARHSDRSLLLSWPPYGFDASPILDAYAGDRVIYIGEGEGGCCGDDAMFETLAKRWTNVAEHVPVQWLGLHDLVMVFERAGGAR